MNTKRILTLLFFFSILNLSAQEISIGYIDLDLIFGNMPEMAGANQSLTSYQTELDSSFNVKYTTFQMKLQSFQESGETMDAVLKKDAEKELQDMQAQIEEFRANASQALEEKRQVLLNPLRIKVKEAINQYAENNGYTHVFSTDGSLVYVKDDKGNISSEIAELLGFSLKKQ
jgi:outer membrane protein